MVAMTQHSKGGCQCKTYSNGLRSEVLLCDHEVSSLFQIDNVPGVSLHFSLKGLMFLQFTLWREAMIGKLTISIPDIRPWMCKGLTVK